MSASNVLHDLYKAPYEEFLAPNPGFSEIAVDRQDEVFPLNSTSAAVALILAAPTKAGLRCMFASTGYSSAMTVTVTNYDGSTFVLTFTAAGRTVMLVSTPVSVASSLSSASGSAENYNWKVVFSDI